VDLISEVLRQDAKVLELALVSGGVLMVNRHLRVVSHNRFRRYFQVGQTVEPKRMFASSNGNEMPMILSAIYKSTSDKFVQSVTLKRSSRQAESGEADSTSELDGSIAEFTVASNCKGRTMKPFAKQPN